ncbi:MAG: hypothetical protein IKB71_04380 [Lentisphaeria bacterium]|nr:hypothetical protein [Lentisphaeria bacterium]
MALTLEISSAVAENEGGVKILQDFAAACHQYGFIPSVQLHNTVSQQTLQKIIDCGLPMSAHAPIVGDYSLNLATEKNLDIIFDAFDKNADFMRQNNIKRSVFHGFSMCDDLIPRMRCQDDYRITLKKSCRDEFLLEDSWLNVDFSHLEEYRTRQHILKKNLAELRRRYPDLLFCIENDMPIYGYSNMKLAQMAFLEHPVCIDIGHLYSSSLLFDFDFFAELEFGMQNLDVQMIHFHNSLMTAETPKKEIRDGHQRLVTPSKMNWQKALKIFLKYNMQNFVLEIGTANADDVHAFARIANS